MVQPNDAAARLTAIQSGQMGWDELAELARSAPVGVRGAALMALGRRFADEPRTIGVLDALAQGPSRDVRLMGIATVGHVCLLLMREMRSSEALEAFTALRRAWPAEGRADLESVLRQGL